MSFALLKLGPESFFVSATSTAVAPDTTPAVLVNVTNCKALPTSSITSFVTKSPPDDAVRFVYVPLCVKVPAASIS